MIYLGGRGSQQPFMPPITFRMVVQCDGNDVRLGSAFNQMIFHWEMRPTELRVDGGPVGGKYNPDAGALPKNRWTGIEPTVTRSECIVSVDGVERYRMAGDCSKVNGPLSIVPHVGTMKIHSIDAVRQPSAAVPHAGQRSRQSAVTKDVNKQEHPSHEARVLCSSVSLTVNSRKCHLHDLRRCIYFTGLTLLRTRLC